MRKKWISAAAAVLAVTCAISLFDGNITPVPDTVQAASVQKVKIGKTYSVKKADASYKSSDPTIAYVSSDGLVTGKKKGTVTITITKNGKKTQKKIRVVANAKKPALSVCADEISVGEAEIALTPQESEAETADDSQEAETGETDDATEPVKTVTGAAITYLCSVKLTVKNTGEKKVKKIVLTGRAGKKKLVFTWKNVKAGSTVKLEKTFKLTATAEPVVTFSSKKLEVYSSGMVHVHSYKTGWYRYRYATADKKAPTITGFVGKNSYNDGIPYQTVYTDQKDSFDYFAYVKAADDRDVRVTLTVDTSKVNFKKKGTYTITYTAVDKAGNKTKKQAKIAVRVNDSLDDMADKVLGSIIKDDWSAQKKAEAIYNYIRKHISYSGTSDKSSWETEAANGIRYGRGDCYTYYCVSRILLTRAGIPNIEVTRVKGHGHHWWNMAYVCGGFYHFDACPRKKGGRFCLVTDDQLKEYSTNTDKDSYIWDYDGKPKTPEEKLSSIF